MAEIRPFRALRPRGELAKEVAALPYDVYSRAEAAAAVQGKPHSFLNIDRPETAFPLETDMYGAEVYRHASELFSKWIADGILIEEEALCFYVYALTMDGREQTGLAALSSADDYLNGVCKKHENTTEAKEQDRIRHVSALSAQTGPIFLSYHSDEKANALIARAKEEAPLYDFTAEDGIRHTLWRIADTETIRALEERFAAIGCTYIADGHHRAASAVKAALRSRAENPRHTGEEEYNYFLSVLFPDSELRIYDYNRVVKDLNGYDVPGFLEKLAEHFEVTELGRVNVGQKTGNGAQAEESAGAAYENAGGTEKDAEESEAPARESSGKSDTAEERWGAAQILRPEKKHSFGMYLDGAAYRLTYRVDAFAQRRDDPVAALDVSILQDEVLSPLLGIGDPRTDRRIEFVGGIRGLSALCEKADAYAAEQVSPAVAFALYPTTMEELFAVADAGRLMPPKSTWFEPKLRSGLLIHRF